MTMTINRNQSQSASHCEKNASHFIPTSGRAGRSRTMADYSGESSGDESMEAAAGEAATGEAATGEAAVAGKKPRGAVVKTIECPSGCGTIELTKLRPIEVQCDECDVYVSHTWIENFGMDKKDVTRLRENRVRNTNDEKNRKPSTEAEREKSKEYAAISRAKRRAERIAEELPEHQALYDGMTPKHRAKYDFPRDTHPEDMTKEERAELRKYKGAVANALKYAANLEANEEDMRAKQQATRDAKPELTPDQLDARRAKGRETMAQRKIDGKGPTPEQVQQGNKRRQEALEADPVRHALANEAQRKSKERRLENESQEDKDKRLKSEADRAAFDRGLRTDEEVAEDNKKKAEWMRQDRIANPAKYAALDKAKNDKKKADPVAHEKEKERCRVRAQKTRDAVYADKAAHAALKEKDNARHQRERAALAPTRKQLKDSCVRIEPPVTGGWTVASLAGHFAGDGCVRPGSLKVLSATKDVTNAFKDVFGGRIYECNRGYFTWTLPDASARPAVEALLPYTWGKQEQLREWLGGCRPELMSSLKHTVPVIDMEPAIRDGVIDEIVGGFLGSDGNVHVRGIDTFRPIVVFAQKYRPILDAIHDNFAGGQRVIPVETRATPDGELKPSFRLEYKGAPAMDLIRRVEPYVTVAYKRSICRAILDMAPDLDLQKMVWGLQKASKDVVSSSSDNTIDDESADG